jgi:hypothetical protein
MSAVGPKQEVVVRQARGDMRTFARAFRPRNPDLIPYFPNAGNGDRRVPIREPAVAGGLSVDETRPVLHHAAGGPPQCLRSVGHLPAKKDFQNSRSGAEAL